MGWKRLLGWLALLVGVVGLAACGVGAYVVHRLAARLEQAADRGFDAVDTGLAFAEDRARGTLDRVREANAATRRAADTVSGWTARTAAERLAARRILDRLGEAVTGHLHSADLRLEAATASLRHGQQLLSVAALL